MRMYFTTICIEHQHHLPLSDSHRFLVVLQGHGSLVLDNRRFILANHDFLELPSHTNCVFENEESSSVLFGVMEMPDWVFTSHHLLQLAASETDLIRKLFYLGLDLQEMYDTYYYAVHETLNLLVVEAVLAAGMKTKTINQQVFDVIKEINEHFCEPDFDVTKAMTRTGYSANHLRKLFKVETGATPSEFVTIRRLDKAKELMRSLRNRVPIKEIASRCGYQDPFYFSRQFKSFNGVSPQAFIEQLEETQGQPALK